MSLENNRGPEYKISPESNDKDPVTLERQQLTALVEKEFMDRMNGKSAEPVSEQQQYFIAALLKKDIERSSQADKMAGNLESFMASKAA